MTPSRLPELRARMLETFMDWRVQGYTAARIAAQYATKNEAREMELVAALGNSWRDADLFYVAPEMAALADDARLSMPAFEMHESDMPSDTGAIYFDGDPVGGARKAGAAPVRLMLWQGVQFDATGRRAVLVSLYSTVGEIHDLSAAGGVEIVSILGSDRIDVFGPLLYVGNIMMHFGAEDRGENPSGLADVLLSAWRLMQQPSVVEVTTPRPERAARRRMERANIDPTVRVIQLRRRSRPSGDGSDGSGRAYHHRWMVRGHWRQQWYSSQERHAPVWIAPHVKGPDDAPMLGGEKVWAWTR